MHDFSIIIFSDLGIFNNLFDLLAKLLDKLENCSLTIDDWSKACGLGIRPQGFQGWNGNDCDKLLKSESLEKLKQMLEQSNAWYYPNSYIPEVYETLVAFSKVKEACFGIELKQSYLSDIKEFADSYYFLVHKELINVTTKVHIGMLKVIYKNYV